MKYKEQRTISGTYVYRDSSKPEQNVSYDWVDVSNAERANHLRLAKQQPSEKQRLGEMYGADAFGYGYAPYDPRYE